MNVNGNGRPGIFSDLYGEGLLKPIVVQQRLSVSRSWLYSAVNEGRIPPSAGFHLGGPDGPVRFDPRGLDEWIAAERANWTPGRKVAA